MSQAVRHPTRARGPAARHSPGTMNRTEAAYASGVLEPMKRSGAVLEYWFEQLTLKLAADLRYTPDFLVQMQSGELEVHEVKGWFREDALIKVKIAAQMFPFRFIVAKLQGREWSITEF